MNKTFKLVLSVAVVLAIAGGYYFPKLKSELGGVRQQAATYANQNGVVHEYRSALFGVGTSTPCSFLSPAATSTLVFASLEITNASSTATTWAVAKATKPNATTTVLAVFPQLASGALGTFVATTTAATSVAGNGGFKPDTDTTVVLGPSQYVTWSVTGLTDIGYDATEMGGSCKAEFIVN